MLIANDWEEYEILDAGDGAKLERWGTPFDKARGKWPDRFILSRPDPQVLWPKEKPEPWDKADGVYMRNKNGSGVWKWKKEISEKFVVNYGPAASGLKFFVQPTNFKHMGLFPEQAVNWEWSEEKVKKQKEKTGREIKILNLFAYTGAATIACAKAGAKITHVDSAKGMVLWAKENAKLNSVEARWIVDDVLRFVEREKRRGEKYDAIIMDPPSYGRGTTGETWKIETMLWPLVSACRAILSDNPLFFIINSYTTGLSATVIGNILESALGDLSGTITAEEIVLPISGSKKLLPAGITGRWQKS